MELFFEGELKKSNDKLLIKECKIVSISDLGRDIHSCKTVLRVSRIKDKERDSEMSLTSS